MMFIQTENRRRLKMGMTDYESCDTCDSICPYCKHQQDYSGDPLGDDEDTTTVCDECNSTYTIICSATYKHQCYTQEDINSED